METVCGHGKRMQVWTDNFTYWISVYIPLKFPVEQRSPLAQIPTQGLRQCGEQMHWRQADEQHMADLKA